jgi:hypothetical protein
MRHDRVALVLLLFSSSFPVWVVVVVGNSLKIISTLTPWDKKTMDNYGNYWSRSSADTHHAQVWPLLHTTVIKNWDSRNLSIGKGESKREQEKFN